MCDFSMLTIDVNKHNITRMRMEPYAMCATVDTCIEVVLNANRK